MLTPILLCITAFAAYFLGNINGALFVSRRVYHKDIRKYGSGNAGLTNFHRTFGTRGLGMVLAVDVIKTVIAIIIGWLLMSIVAEPVIGRIFAGFCVMLGHAFPVLNDFKGGKCALCGVVLLYMTHPAIGVICTIIALLVILFSRYVSLGSIITALVYPFLVWGFGLGKIEGLVGLFAALLLVFMHRENIKRLVSGTESKLHLGKQPEKKLDEDEF